MTDQPRPEVLQHTARVVSAHVGHNKVAADALPQLIQSVYQALSNLGNGERDVAAARPEPAVPVRRSVFPDYIVCLEDGAKMKMLKRYLQVRFGLTPAAYRERWGLPSDYPMVAPNYTERRSALARQIGLGRKPAANAPAEADAVIEDEAEPAAEAAMDAAPEQAAKAAKPRARRKPKAAEAEG